MSDAAAFFAKKKKGGKKKSFKAFNANKIDATAVASTVHVDAPAISNNTYETTVSPTLTSSGPSTSDAPNLVDEEWATPMQKAPTANVAQSKRGTVTELLDMNALEARRREEDDVVERLRVEETKAALTSARMGMEKEAQRLKEEEEAKKQKEEDSMKVQNASVRSNIGGGGTKWVPPHLRGSSAALGNSRLMMSKARGEAPGIDTKDDNDFPDLASANAAIEEQKKQEEQKKLEKKQLEKERMRIASKNGGVAPWGSGKHRNATGSNAGVRQPLKIAPPKKTVDPSLVSKTEDTSAKAPDNVDPVVAKTSSLPDTQKPSSTTSSSAQVTEAPVVPTPASAEKPVMKKKKKKKKDLSTFQPSS